MTAIRRSGKINEDTTLIDYGLHGVSRVGAVYLIQAGKTCLIDGGTRDGAGRMLKALRGIKAFPDTVIITHSHWDHCQAIPALRKQAARLGKEIKVLASERAVPLLEDQSWSEPGCENITGVTPLEEGDVVDLQGVTLRILDTPGHCKDHIAVLDEKNRNIFVGDAIGVKVGDNVFVPPFFLPFWDRDAYYATIGKLKQVDYDTLCLAHYGYIYGDEAKSILDESVVTYERWWQLFEQNVEKLDDLDYMLEVISRGTGLAPIDYDILSPRLRLLFGLMTGWNKLVRKKPQPIGALIARSTLASLITAYKTYENLA
jgi:glyoxylase-like metal-dependent hydrolase (beta-lactamase superfamily II)